VSDGEAPEDREEEDCHQETTGQVHADVETSQDQGTEEADLSACACSIAVAANRRARRIGSELSSSDQFLS
jgi:hypothetical protein